jgi:hypothetical protein
MLHPRKVVGSDHNFSDLHSRGLNLVVILIILTKSVRSFPQYVQANARIAPTIRT